MSRSYNYKPRDPGYPSERQPQQSPSQTRAPHLLPPPSVQTSSYELNRLLNPDDHSITSNNYSLPPLQSHPANFPLSFSYQSQTPSTTSQFRHREYLPHAISQAPTQPVPAYASSWEYSEHSRTIQNPPYKMDHAGQSAQTISFYAPNVNQNVSNQSAANSNISVHQVPNPHLASTHQHTPKSDPASQETLMRSPPVTSIPQLLSVDEENNYSYDKQQNAKNKFDDVSHRKPDAKITSGEEVQGHEDEDAETETDIEKDSEVVELPEVSEAEETSVNEERSDRPSRDQEESKNTGNGLIVKLKKSQPISQSDDYSKISPVSEEESNQKTLLPSESAGPSEAENDSSYDNKLLVDYMLEIRRRQQRVVKEYEERCRIKQEKLKKKFLSRIQNRPVKSIKLSKLESRSASKVSRRGKKKIDKKRISRKANMETSSFMEEDSGVERRREVTHKKKLQRQKEAYEIEERKRIWRDICRNAIPRMSKIVSQSTSSRTNNARKIAQICQKEARKAALKSCKSNKDVQTKARQAMRQMLVFWKRNEKEEREMRKKAEKEAMERMRVEEELREAKRQARKLNFLINQTELYSHFVGKKIGTQNAEGTPETSVAVEGIPASSIDAKDIEDLDVFGDPKIVTTFAEINFDEEDDEALREKARASAQNALAQVKKHTRNFDDQRRTSVGSKSGDISVNKEDLDQMNFQNPSSMPSAAEIKQPSMLKCQLKEYQLKGLNWLANLYEQGINGILADEMGLGKTVQSIALMAHLAETHNIWGPFLVIAPSSTLHNWQQEISRFVPNFKSLPYWGNPNDRKVLRKFLNKKNLVYSKDAPFHIVITSYQLIVQDKAYFERTKWQYMVLDEAQAIKSSSSARWKTLLGFQCRNRLLLTGTPIQNSMQELWALLHFIMPTLFDSHQEFSEWFSKDIESHAENKGSLNEHQLRRLHMILKPFMLRRVKKNVQNELGDKIELEVFSELTARQRMLYRGLREKISVTELLERVTSLNENESVDSLMNLVMQFRKVCNHPELFERADVVAPLSLCNFSMTWMISREGDNMYLPYSSKNVIKYNIPKTVYRNGGMLNIPSHDSRAGTDAKYLDRLMNIWRPDYIQESIREETDVDSTFSFLRFIDTSPSEASSIFYGHFINRWVLHLLKRVHRSRRRFYITQDHGSYPSAPINTYALFLIMDTAPAKSLMNTEESPVLEHLTNVLAKTTQYDFKILEPCYMPKAIAPPIEPVCSDKCFYNDQERLYFDPLIRAILLGINQSVEPPIGDIGRYLEESEGEGILGLSFFEAQGYSYMRVPAMKKLIMDSGKLTKLDKLLEELKAGGHRVLIYFQMTRMIDLMEEYLAYRQYKYLRLDGSSKISDRRDMVSDWQTRPDIFIFLLSTRAGGLGINLTAADTVVFYDSDWNPTVDQQAMDRAHRLGQTKQVTVYRLITKGTIEERILQRAKQKDEIQKVVISGGEFKQVDFNKPREIVSLLLEDGELESKLRENQLKRKVEEEEENGKKKGRNKKPKKEKGASASSLSKNIDDLWNLGEPAMLDTDAVSTPSSVGGTSKKKRNGASQRQKRTRATKKGKIADDMATDI